VNYEAFLTPQPFLNIFVKNWVWVLVKNPNFYFFWVCPWVKNTKKIGSSEFGICLKPKQRIFG
jgi:hypothetical protein